jgi:hypothetical protein
MSASKKNVKWHIRQVGGLMSSPYYRTLYNSMRRMRSTYKIN